MSEPRFHHTDVGTAEPHWFADAVWDEVPAIAPAGLGWSGVRELVVLAAHPDDETIGAGATIAAAADLGVPVTFVLATAGEGSHPDAQPWTPADIADARLAEWQAAIATLAPDARSVVLHLPDGGLRDAGDTLRAAVAPHVAADLLVLAPWRDDGHPDHDALGACADQLAAATGARCWHYPIWWWHWNRPADARTLLAERGLLVEAPPAAVRRKHAALAAYRSQHTGLGPGPAHGPIVTGSIAARARRTFEVLFVDQQPAPSPPADPATAFDAMFDEGDDPWGWEASWYERRRRSLLLASLRRERYANVLEVGCGTGLLTVELADRADAVTAVDVSERALAVARRRGLPGVEWRQGTVPLGLPEAGSFDLVVVSELGYFLRPSALIGLLRRCRKLLAPGGEIIFADWRHPTRDIPLDGELVHELVGSLLGLPRVSRYEDDDVLVEVWSDGPSPAALEGLT